MIQKLHTLDQKQSDELQGLTSTKLNIDLAIEFPEIGACIGVQKSA